MTPDVDLDRLREATTSASEGLQVAQALAGLAELDEARVRFPRGYLRTSEQGRQLFPFVGAAVLRTNLAYAVQLADVYTWLLTRTDLAGIARDMVVKAYLGLAGGVLEAPLVDRYRGATGWRQTYASRARRLHADGVIEEALLAEVLWVWDMRNRQHVYDLVHREFDAYVPGDHPRARAAVNGVLRALARDAGATLASRAF